MGGPCLLRVSIENKTTNTACVCHGMGVLFGLLGNPMKNMFDRLCSSGREASPLHSHLLRVFWWECLGALPLLSVHALSASMFQLPVVPISDPSFVGILGRNT